MKARTFLALVLALLLLAFGLGLGGWWLVWRRGPLRLAHQPLSMPRTARFVPRRAPLSLYVFTDGDQAAGYARAVAPPRQRRAAAEAVDRLRDGAFAAAGLDYRSELARWIAPEIAFALLDVPRPSTEDGTVPLTESGWLLAIGSRDEDGARRFLQRFWQIRSLAGADLTVSSYRGMGLISGRGALLGRTPEPLATALVDDDLVLIASGRGVLEQALDVSQIDELNQAGQPRLARRLEELGEGAALLLSRPEAMQQWLGLPLPALAVDPSTDLIATLRPEGRSLRLRAVLDRPASAPPLPIDLEVPSFSRLLDALRGQPSTLALLQDPATLSEDPLLGTLIRHITTGGDAPSPIPALVASLDHGPLLVGRESSGWVLGTRSDQPDPAVMEPALGAEGLIAAPLEWRNRSLLVWTQLRAGPPADRRRGDGDGEELHASLAGWRSVDEDVAWWGEGLALLEKRGAGPEVVRRRRQLTGLDRPGAPLQWALADEPALHLLRAWQPWKLLSALAGGGLDPSVRGLALSLESDPEGALQIEGQLELGRGARS
jgi:hypothetical protein